MTFTGNPNVNAYTSEVHYPRKLLRFVLVPALLVAACGGGINAEDGADTAAVERSATTATTEATTTTEAETTTTTAASTTEATEPPTTVDPNLVGGQLVGRWAHFDVVAYEDGTFKTMIVSYGFNDFTAEDGQIIDTAEFCYSEQVSDQPFESALSDEGTQAIKPPPTPLQISEIDGGLQIYRPPTPTPVGIRLDDPANESLPDDPDDPRIVDDDNDGNPGVTVSIDVGTFIGELYIARREIFAYDATLLDEDLDVITGEVTDTSEQLIIGANNELFLAQESNFVQHPDLTKSPILLKRVDADWDCDRLVAERDNLFPPTPEIDW